MRGDCFNALHSLTNCSFVNIFNFPLQQFALNLPERKREVFICSPSQDVTAADEGCMEGGDNVVICGRLYTDSLCGPAHCAPCTH